MLPSKKEVVAIIILFDTQTVKQSRKGICNVEIRYILSQFWPKYDFNKTQKFISNYDMFLQSFYYFYPIFGHFYVPIL